MLFESVMRQIRIALRTLLSTPVLTGIAVLSLGLGIGANTAIFSLFDSIILRALPVPNPQELVALGTTAPRSGEITNNMAGPEVFSYPMMRDLEKSQTVFTGIAAHRSFGASLAYQGQTAAAEGVYVSGQFFPTLALKPAAGRLITPADDVTPGGHPVVVLSHRYWTERFNANPAVLSQTLIVNGAAMTILGVTPEKFKGPVLGQDPSIYVPISMKASLETRWKGYEDHRSYWIYLMARLKPGYTRDRAQQEINGLYAALIEREAPLQKGASAKFLERFRQGRLLLEPGDRGQSGLLETAEVPLTMLLGIAGFVLLIACANIANLLLAKAANRQREMAIRLSMGATRAQLMGHLLTESMLMAVAGGLFGVILSRWAMYGLQAAVPVKMLIWDASLNPRVLLFTAAVAISTGFVFGLFPAWQASGTRLADTLKDQAGAVLGAGAAGRFRHGLVVAQVAVSLCLLATAALFGRSLVNVMRVDLGLKSENITGFALSPALSKYTPERSLALFEQLEKDLAAIPGARGAAVSTVPLLAGNNWGQNVTVDGFDAGPDTDTHSMFNMIGAGYFRLLGIPMVAGREFDERDDRKAKTVIINQAFARKFNLGPNPVGRRMATGGVKQNQLDLEIIGVVKDAKYSSVKDSVPPLFYLPYRGSKSLGGASIYVASNVPPETIMASIRRAVAKLDPNLPIEDLRTLDDQASEDIAPDRIVAQLTIIFGALATVLAMIGLYGVLAYTVERRTREFGIRQALGAAPGNVRNLVLGGVGKLLALGVLIGVPASVVVAEYARSLLFKLEKTDSWGIIGAATITLGIIAMLAGWIPARRAAGIDPMRALRHD